MVITYPITGALCGGYIAERVWDYSITIAVIHVVLSFLGNILFINNNAHAWSHSLYRYICLVRFI